MKKEKINDIEYEQKTGDYTAERNKKFDWLILVFCVLLSVVIWLIALNNNDPIIEKELSLICVFEGEGDQPDLTPEYQTVLVYGTRSDLAEIDEIRVVVQASDFSGSSTHNEKIVYPDGVKPADDKYKSVNISAQYD